MQLLPETSLQGGKYKIEKVLGQGGFGITYLGLQTGLNRSVAIKEFFMKEYCEREETTSKVLLGSQGSRYSGPFPNKIHKRSSNHCPDGQSAYHPHS